MRRLTLCAVILLLMCSDTMMAQVPNSGLRFWLRASDITGLADGDSISQWNDNSGNGRNAVSSGIHRPIFLTNAANGLPAVRFNGNGGLTKDQPLMVVQDSTVGAVNVFVVLAHQRNPLLGGGDAVDVVMAGKVDFPARGFGFSTYNTFANRANRQVRREGGIDGGTDGVVTIRKNGFAVTPELNLGEFTLIQYDASGFTNTRESGFPFVLGALRDSVRAGQNDIAEVLVYNRTLTTEERNQVQNYLSERYGIPLIPSFAPFTITQIPNSGLQLWLRGEELGNSGFNRGDAVTFWLDASGNARNAVATGAARPTIFNGSVNGYPALRFNGQNNTMRIPLAISGEVTAFVVAANRENDLSEPSVLMSAMADNTAGTTGFALWTSFGGNRTLLAGPTGNGPATLRRNGAASLSLNQNEYVIATYTGTVTNSAGSGIRTQLGAALNDDGFGWNDISEVIVYNRVLTQSEIERVENYLSKKFALNVPSNAAPATVQVDNFAVSDTLLNGWTVGIPAGGVTTRDRYTLSWVTDEGQPALRVGVSGNIGVNGRAQGRRPLPGNAPDTLGGGLDAFWKTIKTSPDDTGAINLSRAKVIHVIAKTDAVNLNAFGRDIPPTLRLTLRDATQPPYIFGTDTLTQRRATFGGRRFSNMIERQATLIPDGKYHEYIFDYTNGFVGLDFSAGSATNFGFGPLGLFAVDSTQIDQLTFSINNGGLGAQTFRHDMDDVDRQVRVVGNTGAGSDFEPIYTTFAPRFRGDVFIRAIIANDSPLPLNPKSTSSNPTVAAGEAGEGAYVFSGTGAFVELRRNGETGGTLTASRGTIPTVDTVQVVDTVGYNNIYRINDGDAAPHIVIPGRVWTINQTGLSADARFDLTLDASGLTNIARPQNLYIAYRPTTSSAWRALSSYTSGNYVKAFNLAGNEFGQFALATKTDRNPVGGLLSTPTNLGGRPVAYQLSQNYPNPFNPSTTISYTLPVSENVSLKVYDVVGREVATLVNARQGAGNYVFQFNASNLASGVYFYRLQAGSFTKTMKMMLVK